MRVVAILFAALATTACERAGADIQNASSQPMRVVASLLPENANGNIMPLVVQPGETVQSVWYVKEHRNFEFSWASGKKISVEGPDLLALANRCPKHCILRVDEAGIHPVMTGIFGKPLS